MTRVYSPSACSEGPIMTQFSIPHLAMLLSPTADATTKMYEFPGLLAGHDAHKRSHIGKVPAPFG